MVPGTVRSTGRERLPGLPAKAQAAEPRQPGARCGRHRPRGGHVVAIPDYGPTSGLPRLARKQQHSHTI